jgi:NAD(P)-dependent dehydrogenase (short-subunit alcohol dehydrogenase family)
LAREGCDLVMTARDAKTLAKSARKVEDLGVRVLAQTCDVRSPESLDYLFTLVRALRRPLDCLVNNAGIAHPNQSVVELPYPTWVDVLETNLTGTFLVTQAALAVMRKGSAIVNNLSIAAERVFPGSAAYNASKHGALGFTDTLRIWKMLWPKAPRRKMMSAETVARAVVNAVLLPADSTVEKLVVMPSGGAL